MTTGPNVIGDGIIFDPTRTLLLVTNGGGSYAGQVSALRSSDHWTSATLVENVPSGCDGGLAPQTATVIVRGKMYTYCAGGFQSGPYTIRRGELPSQPGPTTPSWKCIGRTAKLATRLATRGCASPSLAHLIAHLPLAG